MGHNPMLTDKQAKALRPTDKPVVDGKVTGLLLSPTKSGCKWTLRFTSPVTGKRRDAGLGTYPEISIAEAREKALTMRKLIVRVKTPSTSAIEIEKQLAWLPQPSPSRKPPAKSTTN
ncbi:phage integrase family site specific recombinase [Burkholderia aenigmatica]|uniref:Phage integrase family site specific recombinase n=1 Tax=Burkholderia aenigmatica TaxID=2015348 RepID=A0A6P2QKC7_9BURK|nr:MULTISPECIES: Arm DNA-binding domain-containing protein [Burkholderia]VWC23355.1 phage integrase family site specific recombinase [Burkholderia aenigmatica]